MDKDKFLMPHEKTLEVIFYDCRVTLLKVLDLMSNKSYDETYKYVTSTHDKLFSFTLIVIIIGLMLLLFSSILVE